jgi:hypothetical protein
MGSYEHGYKHSGFLEREACLDLLSDGQFLKKDMIHGVKI